MKNRIFLAPNPVKQISSKLLKLQGGGNNFLLLGREAVRVRTSINDIWVCKNRRSRKVLILLYSKMFMQLFVSSQ